MQGLGGHSGENGVEGGSGGSSRGRAIEEEKKPSTRKRFLYRGTKRRRAGWELAKPWE